MKEKEARTKEAVACARRFIAACSALDKSKSADPNWHICGNRYTAAAKRASMDLTRALADFRGAR